jgi:molecular chaperone DnaK
MVGDIVNSIEIKNGADMGSVIGIDLGTTNSCVAVMEGGAAKVILSSEGYRTTPSVVAFTKDGHRLVGDVAKRQSAVNSDRTIFSIKRQMGTDYRKKIDGKFYTPQELSAFILSKLKKDAEDYLGEAVTDAVITVPAYFNDAQRQATKDAGRIAGLNVLRIINEPTSAALAYGLDNGHAQKILVYDLGGGTFDVSVIDIGDNVIEVLATSGDNHLGGDDFDARVVDYLVAQFKSDTGINLTKDMAAMARLREEAEKAKKELSSAMTANINLPFISMLKGQPVHMDMQITRQQFDSMTADLVDRTVTPVENALHDAGLGKQDIDMVLLVGGSTRIPAVQDKVRKLMGKEPSRNLNPDECVAMGAAIQGGKLSGQLVSSGGAADIILMDVTPMSLSIETLGGIASRIIERNTTIPTRHSQIFTTAGNFQTSVEIKVYQGERKFTRDNKLLGNFKLSGIKRAMAGTPQIEVTFDIDVNGIVNVSAKDLGTGNLQSITITSNSNMTEEEIERAKWEAEVFEKQDSQAGERVQLVIDAKNLANRAHAELSSRKKELDKDAKKRVKEAVNSLEKALGRVKPENVTADEAEKIATAKSGLEQTLADVGINV